MKCSKCGYLGFETSDQCKNCGYDFSLQSPEVTVQGGSDGSSVRAFGRALARETEPSPNPALPLFIRDDDRPLVTVPSVLRAPLAVRRAPIATPRMRALARSETVEPVLDFRDPPQEMSAPDRPSRSIAASEVGAQDSIATRRVLAVVLDHGILLGIDAAVLYFTLRIAGLSVSEIRLVPPVPFLVFLGLLKFSYFAGFTAWGGQTIGKMASGIRVVGDDGGSLGARGGLRRTLAALTVFCTLGVSYLPALLGRDRRSLHDRLTRTRVVALPAA